MQREIKFRGMCKYGANFVYGDLIKKKKEGKNEIQWDIGTYYNDFGLWENDFQVEEDSIGQFIGLKDKNGIEIYEGDKVRNEVRDLVGTVKYCDDLTGDSGGSSHPGYYCE